MDTSFVTRSIAIGSLFAAVGCGAVPLDPEQAPPVAGIGEEQGALSGFLINPPITNFPIFVDPPRLACGIHLAALPGRYDFDAGSTSGWQVSGLFDGDTATRILQIGPGAATFWDFDDAGGSASDTDGRGSAFVLGAASGLPSAPSGWWRQDFISPDVTNSNAWQFATTTFSIQDDITFDGPALQAQVVLEVLKCDGTTAFRREVDAAGNAVFCTVPRTGAWSTCTSRVGLAGVDRVKRIHIRTFGRSGYGYEGLVLIDQVRAS